MSKTDKQPARGRENKPSKEILPDKAAGDKLENTFIFLMFSCFLKKTKKCTFCLSSLLFLPRFSRALPASGSMWLKDRQQLQAKEQKRRLTMGKETGETNSFTYHTRKCCGLKNKVCRRQNVSCLTKHWSEISILEKYDSLAFRSQHFRSGTHICA